VEADAQEKAPVRWLRGLVLRYLLLDRDGAGDGFHHARELSQDVVAHGIDHPTPASDDLGAEEGAAGLEDP